MLLSREIELKLCQNQTKIHIYAILYRSCIVVAVLIKLHIVRIVRITSPELQPMEHQIEVLNVSFTS